MQQWWRMVAAAAVSASLATAPGCGGSIVVALNTIQPGTWGGDHATLVVSESTATLQLDCAHGLLNPPIQMDREGRFDVPGIFVREHGGPIAAGEQDDRHTARFFGSLHDGQLTLFISVGDLDLRLGPFTLSLGGPPHLVRCL